ncbi:ABC transporter ATP-binding protein [Candidatus Bathycorpusculum sp.]|uniref:ABC transporter ATP-binding protein n=1 Tax=Candidatus Bathycorpusculum sp. TaxID=2994959 RepID=UPI00282E7E74|nr:ABC transporter ATP-binding protein [Candidatus Termitimicrobium sp.]MCL2685808.1 ABC transporter ATP-binding protein [Candidatus Termitimicrobium sp.]
MNVNNLSFNYAGVPILNDVEFNVGLGELVAIVGPNGSGKSTLLKCINRILKPKQNSVLINGVDSGRLSVKELSMMMGYVPQTSVSAFPFTVFDVVMMGRKPYIHWSIGERDSEIVALMLDFLGIGHLALRHFSELSGGEQQKVIIARALAQQPEILLLDEPTSSLDIRHQLEILCILRGLAQSGGRSVVVTLHDLNLASRFSDRIIMLKKGCVFAIGSPKEVITSQNIKTVYGICADVSASVMGRPVVTPLVDDFGDFTSRAAVLFETKLPELKT